MLLVITNTGCLCRAFIAKSGLKKRLLRAKTKEKASEIALKLFEKMMSFKSWSFVADSY